jgi:hypothetical protein
MPGIDQIPSELVQTGCETLRSEIHRLIYSIWNGAELPQQWIEFTIVPTNNMDDKINCQLTIIHCCQIRIT